MSTKTKKEVTKRSTIGGQGLEVQAIAELRAGIEKLRVEEGGGATKAEWELYLLKLGFNRALTLANWRKRNGGTHAKKGGKKRAA